MQLSKSGLMARGGQAAAMATGLVVGTKFQVDQFSGPILGVAQGIYTVIA